MSKKLSSILWAIGYAPEKMGSFEEVMIAVAKRAKEGNIRIYYVFPGDPIIELTEKIKDAGGIIVLLPIKNRFDPRFIIRFVSFLKRERIEVVHSHFDLANFPILLSRIFYNKPAYYWHQHHITGSKWPRARKIFYRFLAREAKKIIAISRAVKNDLISKGLRKEKIELIYNGFSIDRFRSDYTVQAGALRSEFNIAPSEIVISCIAQGRPEKGQFYLIEAFKSIANKYPNSKLLLIGAKGHPYFSTLNELSDKLKINKKIVFTEMRNDVPQILYITDIVVIPSLSEGLSYCALEAMASGKPVIASDIGGLPELIDNNKTGILVAPKDIKGLEAALDIVISDKEKRKCLAINAKEFIKRSDFELDSMVDKIFNLYENENESAR